MIDPAPPDPRRLHAVLVMPQDGSEPYVKSVSELEARRMTGGKAICVETKKSDVC